MADLQKLLEEVKSMTVMELNEFVKMVETEFGVSAAAMMAGPAVAAEAAAPVEEQTEFTVVLKAYAADKKIAVIKVVREILGLGLGEAKAMVEGAPCTVKEGLSKKDAGEMAQKFKDAGAEVDLK